MVLVAPSLCVDRFEAILADARTGRDLSPHYPVIRSYEAFIRERRRDSDRLLAEARRRASDAAPADGDDAGPTAPLAGESMDLPPLPEIQAASAVEPVARVRAGAVPSGHVSGVVARTACERAGKRLCRLTEWRAACRGEAARPFPYGEAYRHGACNLARGRHPSRILFGDPSASVLDPRLNLTTLDGEPLLRATGATPACASPWGDDAAYDLVGNLDEWVVDDVRPARPGALALAGASYARYTKIGCAHVIRAHPEGYWDYSTGLRCCADVDADGQRGRSSG